MTPEWATGPLVEHWPAFTLIIAVLIGIYYVVKTLALTVDAVGDALGPLGKLWRSRRTISQAESDDMRRRIDYLSGRVETLLWRDQCYFAYVLIDQDWHHRHELLAVQHGWALEPHPSFLEFRDKWMRERGLDKELEIWRSA
jgi:hypothetical protein